MDELELLKKDWKKNEDSFPKFKYDEIYKMIWKKSSSIVKWIFIISILEFVLWTSITLLTKDSDFNQKFKEYGADNIWLPFVILNYAILFYFLYMFFTNYRAISVVDNAKKLMEKILRTRRTVRHYVIFNLASMAVGIFLVWGIQLNRDTEMIGFKEKAAANGDLLLFYASTIGIIVLAIIIFGALILGFYYLIYGILLKRLKNNYHELKKMEV